MSKVRQRIVQEDGRLYNVWEQPERDTLLRENLERQKVNPRKSDWIKPLASIPYVEHELLKQRRPEVLKDRRLLEKYVNSSKGKAFRTIPRGRSRNFSFGGL